MIKKIGILALVIFKFSSSTPVQVDSHKALSKNGKIFIKNYDTPLTGVVKFKKDREFYKNGIPEGKWVSFYPNGKIKSIENWRQGKLNGKYVLYTEDGNKVFQTYYVNGKDHGNFELYHESGKIHIAGNFINGKATNVWKYYDKKGRFIGEIDYDKKEEHFDQTT